jgi:DNA repair protein RadC
MIEKAGPPSPASPLVRENGVESDLAKRLARYPDFDRDAGEVARSLFAEDRPPPPDTLDASSGPNAESLVRYWRRRLPGLKGQRGWRFLEHLGYPVLSPEAPVRRLLFRFGTLEEQKESGPRVTSAVQELSKVTGVEIPGLRVLLRWTAGGQAPHLGGSWCGTTPRCSDCPLSVACLWARFRRSGETSPIPGPAGNPGGEQRERLKNLPMDDLSDAELLALVIKGGRSDPGAVDTASDLLHRIGEIQELEKSSDAELAQTPVIGRTTARLIKASLELARRAASHPLDPRSKIQGSEDVWAAFGGKFRHISQEHFIVLLFDTKNRFIKHRIVSRGTLDSSAAHPREVFKEAIRASASAVILMHNHPSGDPHPSPEDRAVTRQLVEAGSILSIRVLDHIILGNETYYSFRDRGEM